MKIKNYRILSLFLVMVLTMTMVVVGGRTQKATAATTQFTLNPLPTPRTEVFFIPSSTAIVSTAAAFVTAYKDPSISKIMLTSDLTFTNAEAASVSGYTLLRSLQIDGVDHTLSFTGTSLTGDGFFNLTSAPAANSTFHLKNIHIEKTANANGNILIRVGGAKWEYIFDNFYNDTGVNFAFMMVSGANINVFFRNESVFTKSNDDYFEGIKDVVFEAESNVKITRNADGTAIFFDDSTPYDSVAYYGNDCVTDIEGTNSYPVFYPWKQFDVYPGADVTLRKTVDSEGVMDSYGVANQIYRVDSDAKFSLVNGNGSAIYDQANTITFMCNPGADVSFIGNYASQGAVHFGNANSKVILNSPAYFDIRNNAASGPAFYSPNATSPSLQLVDTSIGAWLKGASLTGVPTSPSPFANVSLVSGTGAPLTGSSTATLNTMAGGWLTNKYSRIAYSVPPKVTATNKVVAMKKTIAINPSVTPSNATVTYSSGNSAIATVDANGVITGVMPGSTTVLIQVKNPEGITAVANISVTVTNTAPKITTGSTISIFNIGGTFNPLAGFTVSDNEDGDLTGSLAVSGGNYNLTVPGVYEILYSVTDSGGSTTKWRRILVVSDGTFAVRDPAVVSAANFTTKDLDVNSIGTAALNSLILTKSNAKSWAISPGLAGTIADSTPQVTVVSTTMNPTGPNPAGTYTAVIAANSNVGAVTRTITITVEAAGVLGFNVVPATLDFGTISLPNRKTLVPRQSFPLSILDSRGPGGIWEVRASISTPLTSTTNASHTLPNALVYVNAAGTATPLSNADLTVFNYTTAGASIIPVQWAADKGVLLEVDPARTYADKYQTVVTWTLVDAP